MRTASLLLGSGFSVPEDLPKVEYLNKNLSCVEESDILIHSDMQALFLNGQEDKNRWCRRDERLFVQEFLEFYNSTILQPGQHFHYETFYDFYSHYLFDNKTNKSVIETFCQNFAQKYQERHPLDALNRILSFNRTFNQLLAQMLHRPEYLMDGGYASRGNYGGFITFLRALLKTHNVKVHSLNHDYFFEWLGNNISGLYEHFSDGFEIAGSPFYGIVRRPWNIDNIRYEKSYRVKLPYFSGRFDTALSLFKLHGTIYNKVIHTNDNQTFRIRSEFGVDEYVQEIRDEKSGKDEFAGVHDNVDPEFLSGTTNKIRHYTGNPFYKNLFTHFEQNLQSSDYLLVIGYGFQDSGINDYLEKYYLKDGRRMIVIDPRKPLTTLLTDYDVDYKKIGVTDMPPEMFSHLLPE